MLDEATRIIPRPGRRVSPPPEAAWLGSALRDGRDVYFSLKDGFGAGGPRPPHATTILLGEMGSGKTSLMRSILLQRLLQGRLVISLDPEGENNRLCLAAGGRVIPAGQPDDPETCLLHPLEAESAGELLFAVRFLVGALDPGGKLPSTAQAAIHDVVQRSWTDRPGERLPLGRLVRKLEMEPGTAVEEVAALLHPFASGGLWDGFFDRPKPLLDRRMFSGAGGGWWNFDLSGLREENKAIVHALLTWFLYRVISVAEAPVDVFLDEGWRLLRSPSIAGLLDELGRRARKRGMGVMLATHLPEDLAGSPTSLAMASTAFVGRLGRGAAETFLAGLGVPAEQAEQHAERIARLPQHTFYAVPGGGRGSLFPFRVRLPPAWLETWGALGAAR
jgi:type IV secretory pathway VirB4 component